MKVGLWAAAATSMVLVFSAECAALDSVMMGIVRDSYNGIAYATGGIGIDERDKLSEECDLYSLQVSLATVDGSFIAGAGITLFDERDCVALHIPSVGPWFFVDVPKGSYTVQATFDNMPRRETVTIGEGVNKVLLHWPADTFEESGQ